MLLRGWLALVLTAGLCRSHGGHHEPKVVGRRVLLVSFDGFRSDYMARLKANTSASGVLNHFSRLIESGVYAPSGVHNVFVTATFPNHYTMATGLYEESHGIVDNTFFDAVTNKIVTYPHEARFYGGEPIWQTVGQQRGKSSVACFQWVGCDLGINGFRFPAVVPFTPNTTCHDHLNALDNWLRQDMQFVMMYFDQPDKNGHRYGPNAPEILDVLLELNDCLGKILQLLTELHLWPDNIDILLVSDHGMERLESQVTIPNSTLYTIRSSTYINAMVDPVPGSEAAALAALRALPNVTVYAKADIPDRLHYRNNERIGNILVTAKSHNILVDDKEGRVSMLGGHGYDTSDPLMLPTFVAAGRSFRRNATIDAHRLWSVDYYLLVCLLLGVTPAPTNASLARVKNVLRDDFFSAAEPVGALSSVRHAVADDPAVLALCVLTLAFVGVFMAAAHVSSSQPEGLRRLCTIGLDAYPPPVRLNLETQLLLEYNSADEDDVLPSPSDDRSKKDDGS